MKIRVIMLSLMILLVSGGVIAANQPTEEPYDEDEYGPAEPIVWTKPLKSVTFSHKTHTMDAGFECDDCHDELFEMEAGAAQELDDFTMASFSEGNYCGACHDGSTAFAADSQCGSCHTEPEETIVWTKPLKSVSFSHETHTADAGFACEDCHDELFTMEAGAAQELDDFTMASFSEGNYCGACHDGSTAFAADTQCGSCHTAPEQTIVWTKPVKAVIFEHATHTEDMGLDCESCHDELFVMRIGAAEQQEDFTMKSLYAGNYCGACHDGSTAFASDTRCTSCHIGVRGYARMSGAAEEGASTGSGH